LEAGGDESAGVAGAEGTRIIAADS